MTGEILNVWANTNRCFFNGSVPFLDDGPGNSSFITSWSMNIKSRLTRVVLWGYYTPLCLDPYGNGGCHVYLTRLFLSPPVISPLMHSSLFVIPWVVYLSCCDHKEVLHVFFILHHAMTDLFAPDVMTTHWGYGWVTLTWLWLCGPTAGPPYFMNWVQRTTMQTSHCAFLWFKSL